MLESGKNFFETNSLCKWYNGVYDLGLLRKYMVVMWVLEWL